MDAARIEEVIGDFVSLKKRGANHIGCCPFHNEKTPSFYVSPSKGIFKCFGCGEAGDVVSFLKKHEHFTYPEALRWLARKYNIEIQEEEQTEEQKERQNERDALFHLSEFAQQYFADLLYNDEMGRAVGLSYFHGRGLSDEIIKRFGLGYCLDEWTNFTDHARKNGYSDIVLEKTGLTIFKESGDKETGDKKRAYDRFRGRVMFPIYSISGRVLGFSGRVLSSEKQAAKYVNSPDSDIYNKSRILYGLFQARSAISKVDKCYLVEGNVDVISMHQSGVENTVASCGTSLTTEQIRLIKRYTPNVTVLYDGDSAGIKAALRAVNLLFAEGMHVRCVLFPDGEDPDSYAQKYGSTALQEYLATHEDNFLIFKTRVLLDGVKNDPIRKAELVKDTVATIALVPDLIERTEYIAQCAHLLDVPEEALASELSKAINQNRLKQISENNQSNQNDQSTQSTPNTQSTPTSDLRPPAPDLPIDPSERHLIQLLLNYGHNSIELQVPSDDGSSQLAAYSLAELVVNDLQADDLSFSDPLCQRIYLYYCDTLARGEEPDASRFITDDDDALRSFAISLMLDTYRISDTWRQKQVFVPSLEDHLQEDLTETLLTFKMKCVDNRIADNARRFREVNSNEDIDQLLAEKKHLVDLRRQIGLTLHRVIN